MRKRMRAVGLFCEGLLLTQIKQIGLPDGQDQRILADSPQ
jgi:hypothetical protein